MSMEQAMTKRGRLLKGVARPSGGAKPRYASLGHDVPVVEVKVHFEAPVPRPGHAGETLRLEGVSFRKSDYELLDKRLHRQGYGLVLPAWGKKGPTRPVVIKKTKRGKLTENEIKLLAKMGVSSDRIPQKLKHFPFTCEELTRMLVSLNISAIAQNRSIIERMMRLTMTPRDVEKLDGILRTWGGYAVKTDLLPHPTPKNT